MIPLSFCLRILFLWDKVLELLYIKALFIRDVFLTGPWSLAGEGPAIGTDWLHFRTREHVDKSEGSGALLGLQLPPLTACGTLGNALYLSVPQFPPCKMKVIIVAVPEGHCNSHMR